MRNTCVSENRDLRGGNAAVVVETGGASVNARARSTARFSAVLGWTLGLFFVLAGVMKLSGWEWAMHSYLQHHPLWVFYFSAVVEVTTGVGLIVPRTRFAASVAQLTLIVWVTFFPWHGIDAATVVPAAVTTLLLIALAWLTRPRTVRGRSLCSLCGS